MIKKKGFFARLGEASRYVFNASMYRNARPDRSNLFSHATFDSINQQNNHWDRETLIAKARSVVVNNAFASNAVRTIQNGVIGSGPRVQITSKNISNEELADMEAAWNEWASEIHLTEKLRAMLFARIVDGEAFCQYAINRRLTNGVKLDMFLFDSMRVTNNEYEISEFTDGIKIDAFGNPVSYRVLKRHPNESGGREYVDVKASQVAHLYKRNFPEQRRGISEMQSALDLFALIDRYSRATVKAAEMAANIGLVFHTDEVADYSFANDDNPSDCNPFIEASWGSGTTITLPEGWNATQVKAEQPVSSYSPYMSSLLNQVGAALGVPKILLQSSAEQSNYSSARLDVQSFQAQCRVDREQLVNVVLMPLFRFWLKQWADIHNKTYDVSCRFFFDQFILLDAQKEAAASETMLQNNLTTLAHEYAKRGMDWEEQLVQRSRELEAMKKLNILNEEANGNERTVGSS